MVRTFQIGAAAFVLLTLVPTVRAGDTIDDVEKKLEEASKKVKSYTCKLAQETNADYGQGMSMKSKSTGTMEVVIKDGKMLMHMEGADQSETSAAGQEMKSAGKTVLVSDGQFMWTLREDTDGPMKGNKMCTKMKASDDPVGLKASKEHFTLKLLPDAKVDGQDCWVVEMTPKDKDAQSMPGEIKSVNYFRKDAGIMIKSESTLNGKPMQTMTLSDIKLDADVKPDRFTFKVPDGVQVQDLTAMQGLGGGDDEKDEPKKADPKKEEPRKDEPKKDEKKEAPKKP